MVNIRLQIKILFKTTSDRLLNVCILISQTLYNTVFFPIFPVSRTVFEGTETIHPCSTNDTDTVSTYKTLISL